MCIYVSLYAYPAILVFMVWHDSCRPQDSQDIGSITQFRQDIFLVFCRVIVCLS